MSPAARARLRIQLAGKRQVAMQRARRRMMIGLVAFGGLTLLIGARLADLALIDRDGRGIVQAAAFGAQPRAPIIDRNGADLARSFRAFALAVKPGDIVGDPRELAEKIAAILGERDPADIYRELTHKGGWRYIQRRILPEDAVALKNLGEPGLKLEREWERVYPNQRLAAHIVGYTNVDGLGQAGLERELETRLKDPNRLSEPLELAIDARVQFALSQELQKQMEKHSAIGAAGIVMDVHTGELIALTSLPVFDPNAAGRGTLEAQFNRATYGVYELGSAFKSLTIAMALDSGVVTSMAQGYDASKPLKAGRFRINDFHAKRRWLSVPEIFMHSSNIGTALMAKDIGAERQQTYLRKLDMLGPPRIELAEKGRPLYPATWGEISTMTIAYGHGLAVTPLHLAASYAALVNGGIYREPTLLKLGADEQPKGRRVFRAEVSDQMRALMRLVVAEGTGGKAAAEGYRVGGKTGTAEKPENGGYARKALVTTFAGAFPMDDPRYVVIAMLDEPKATKDTYGYATAGWTAAPVVARTVARIAPILGVAPSDTRDVDLAPLLAHVRGEDRRG